MTEQPAARRMPIAVGLAILLITLVSIGSVAMFLYLLYIAFIAERSVRPEESFFIFFSPLIALIRDRLGSPAPSLLGAQRRSRADRHPVLARHLLRRDRRRHVRRRSVRRNGSLGDGTLRRRHQCALRERLKRLESGRHRRLSVFHSARTFLPQCETAVQRRKEPLPK